MTATWDDEYRTSIDDCNDDRCPINKFEGQCHLRRGHVGACDPHGLSHWESGLEAAPGVDGVQLDELSEDDLTCVWFKVPRTFGR